MAMNFMNWLQSGRSTGSKAVLLTLCASLVWFGVQAAESIAVRPDSPQNYTVQQGDTLSGIAAEATASGLYEGSGWQPIFQANEHIIAEPNAIQPGMALRIPAGF